MSKRPEVDVRDVPITLQIGKNGITEALIVELESQLTRRKVVKIKLLRAFIEENNRKEAAKMLAERTQSQLIALTGFMIILYKPKKTEL